MWATAKAILRWSCIYLNSYIRIEDKNQFSKCHFKKVEKEEKMEPKKVEGKKYNEKK